MRRRETLLLLAAAGVRPVWGDAERIQLEPGKDSIRVVAGGNEFTTFHYSPEFDRPFVHPLITPSGTVISRGVPPAAGEDSDHAWHRGLWYAHGDISGADFWRERVDKSGRKTTGRMVVSERPRIDGSSLSARCALTTAEGKVIGTCVERFRFARLRGHNVIDVGITMVADGGVHLVMGDSDDGGLAIRLTTEFEQENGAALLNSEGAKGTENLWGKPARWVDYSAMRNGKVRGAAILDHPSNFRYPARWHARGYGLNSANPFAAGSFQRTNKKDKARRDDGEWTIRRGAELSFRYRVVLHDGDAAQAGIEAMQQDFGKTESAL